MITVAGKEYPCYPTMGAMLMYKRHTDKEATTIGQDGVSDLLTLLWCYTVCACEVDGVEFGYDLQQFANRVSPEAFQRWVDSIVAEAAGEPEQKKSKGRR